jgi:hypothetical protein
MKGFIIFGVLLLAFPLSSFSQKSKKEVKEVYIIWVEIMDKSETLRGNLLDLGEGEILVRDERGTNIFIPVENIRKLQFNEKDAVRKGALTGAAIGLAGSVVAGIVYLFSGDKSEDAVMEIGAFIGTAVAMTGILAGYGAMQASSKYSYLI